jgi:hypothetical protein
MRLPGCGEGLRIRPPALETRPMPGRQRGHLVEEKQFGVAGSPYGPMTAPECERAADPLFRRPAPGQKPPLAVVDAAAAITHEKPTGGVGQQFAERGHAVLQGHAMTP